jgi:hypothetical protein
MTSDASHRRIRKASDVLSREITECGGLPRAIHNGSRTLHELVDLCGVTNCVEFTDCILRLHPSTASLSGNALPKSSFTYYK